MSESNSEDDLYDFAPEAPPAKPPSRLRVAAPPAPGTPIVLQYRKPRDDKPAPVDAEQIKHVYLPLWLLGGGIVVELISAVIWTHQIGPELAELSLQLTLGTGLMLLAMWITAKLRGLELGPWLMASYKLAAISVAPGAVADFMLPLTHFSFLLYLPILIVEFSLFFALLGALFELDTADTWLCVWIIFLVRVAFYFLLKAIF